MGAFVEYSWGLKCPLNQLLGHEIPRCIKSKETDHVLDAASRAQICDLTARDVKNHVLEHSSWDRAMSVANKQKKVTCDVSILYLGELSGKVNDGRSRI